MDLNLQGDWTLITGATSGIGYEMAKIFARRGDNMVLVGRSEERLCQVAREMTEVSDVIVMPVDLGVSGAAKVLYDECERLGLDIHVLINNAGHGKFGESTTMSPDELEMMLTLNVTSLTNLSKLFGNRMKDRGRGFILNVASTAAFQSIPFLSAYAASKTYVHYFTNALREELKSSGITVSCLFPGPTDTRLFEKISENRDPELFRKQQVMPAREVASIAIEGLFKGRRTIIPGSVNKEVPSSPGFVAPRALARIIRKYSHN